MFLSAFTSRSYATASDLPYSARMKKEAYKQYKDQFDIEPSSAVVFGVLPKLKFKKEDKIILINSGKGIL